MPDNQAFAMLKYVVGLLVSPADLLWAIAEK